MTALDHTTCPAEAHDRSLPQPLDGQAVAADGLLGCNDCGRAVFWCERYGLYQHVESGVECFLIGARP